MDIKTKKRVLTAFTLIAILAGFAFSIYRAVLLKQYYDPYSASFESGSRQNFRIFEYALIIASIIISLSFLFARKSKFQLFSTRYSTTSITVCAICGFIFAAIGILVLAKYSDDIFEFTPSNILYKTLLIISVFTVFAVALYFFCCASVVFRKFKAKSSLSLILPIFGALYLGAAYFNDTIIFYNSNRITCQIAFIAILLFLLSEANIATGNGAYAFHFAMSLVAIIAVSAYILPALALISFWEMEFTMTMALESSSIAVLIYAVFSAFNSIRTLTQDESEPDKA